MLPHRQPPQQARINQSINEDLTSGSLPEGDVRDVPSGTCSYKQFKPPEHTCKNIDRRKRKRDQNSASPLSKAGKSVQAAKVGRDEFLVCPGKC